ncbi:RsmE family RNA methyltransferase [Phocicoccus pinnipedialis]|uniref:Ribosomal RNA small subunit methyltransferase E n=1 Tax=Phocicoccus pinnipedialis TaxID=110845 RepID=A0A6V7REV9_9BACL|nr:16S rRNA (uracil(1498)-N(3))-methyltransferase [Jeotgalicoccus pinnipedialis]MBP1939258.1 16S rRNA (uracil1498-N3)-methyltransferase [Jeotgalicoccus pinnipedialis]CAD2076117.1 Ribosomal RNA small subunit methyltransferase E [Jeotgalicoccus pinnipedialis]
MQQFFSLNTLKLNKNYTDLEKDAHHMLNVMRMSLGDTFRIVDIDNKVYKAEITEVSPLTYLTIEEIDVQKSNISKTVICPLLKGEKFDFMIQKATELGADVFLIYEADRAVVKLDDKKRKNRLTRFKKIIQGASEQSKRLTVPTIEFVGNLKSIDLSQYDLNLFAYEDLNFTKSESLIDVLNNNKKFDNLSIIFGPEGGFSKKEIEVDNLSFVKLGERILRAETAPLYMLSVIDAVME